MVCIVEGSHILTCHSYFYPQTEQTIPAFASTAEAGLHLPTSEGWKAELGYYIDIYVYAYESLLTLLWFVLLIGR